MPTEIVFFKSIFSPWMIWVGFFYLTWRGGLGSLIWIQSVQHEGKFSFLEALECFHSIAFFSPGAFITMQSTPTRNFKYTTSFNKTNEIIHIHCISTEMLCRAMMSPYKVSTNQVLWSEPTLLTLGESRIEAAACFSVITDRIPEISHPKKKGISAAWVCPCWGLEQMSPLHSCTLITSTPLWLCSLGCSSSSSSPMVMSQNVTSPAALYYDFLHSVLCWRDIAQFVTGPMCSLGLYKPPGMYTRKMYIIKHPEQSWPPQASPKHHKHLNENCLRWEKHRYVLNLFGQSSSWEALFFYQTRLTGPGLCREIGHRILS